MGQHGQLHWPAEAEHGLHAAQVSWGHAGRVWLAWGVEDSGERRFGMEGGREGSPGGRWPREGYEGRIQHLGWILTLFPVSLAQAAQATPGIRGKYPRWPPAAS